MVKKLTAILMIIMTLVMLGACGNNKDDASNKEKTPEIYKGVYNVSILDKINDTLNDASYISDMAVISDKLVYLLEEYKTEGIIVTYNISDLEGNIEKEQIITDTSKTTNKDCYAYKILNNGKVVYIENTFDEKGNTTNLVLVDADNNIEKHDIIEYVPEGMYINSISESPNGRLYLISSDKILDINLSDNSVTTVNVKECNTLTTPLAYNDENPVFMLWDSVNEQHSLTEININTGDIISRSPAVVDFLEYSTVKVRGNDISMISSADGLYSYSLEDGHTELILDYINSSLFAYRFKSISFVNNKQFIGEYVEDDSFKSKLALFTLNEGNSISDSQKIVMVAINSIPELKKGIIDYNKSQSEYRIELVDCKNNVENFNNIIENKQADIAFVDDSISIDKFGLSERFLNLNDIIKKDKSFDKKSFAVNFFEAYKLNDKLYQIPTKVSISTVLGKESIFGEYNGINWDEFNALDTEYPEMIKIGNTSDLEMLDLAMRFVYHDFVNIADSTSDFITEDFEKLLDFCIKTNEVNDNINSYNSSEYEVVTGNTLLTNINITSIYDAWAYGYRTFGEESYPVGFPCKNKDGHVVSAVSSFAILENTDKSEQCWEFIKLMLSENYQNGDEARMYASESLPVLKSALELQIETIQNNPFYIDTEGNKVEYKNSFLLNNEVVELIPASEETANKWLKFILSIDKRSGSGYTEELKIISNSAEKYFTGNCTAEEASASVQSYMSEYVQNVDLSLEVTE